MSTYILKRLLLIPPMLVAITLVSFLVITLSPGVGGAMGGGDLNSKKKLTADQIEVLKDTFHYGEPIWRRYLYWLGVLQAEPSNSTWRGFKLEYANKKMQETESENPAEAEKYSQYYQLFRKLPLDRHLPDATWPEDLAKLDAEIVKQYPNKGVIFGDFGQSVSHKTQSVGDRLWAAIPVTILMSLISILIIYLVSIPLGVYSATHQGQLGDNVMTVALFVLYSLPSFWVAILLIKGMTELKNAKLPFLPYFGLFPDGADDMPTFQLLVECTKRLFLPILCSCYGGLATLSRFMRVGMIDIIRSDYIRTARAKGCNERTVIYKHALRNSLIPIVTILAGLLPGLIGGSFIIETIFSINGMGYLAYTAILERDYTVLMADLTLVTVLTLFGMLLSDILYVIVDPRIQLDKQS